MKVPRDKNGRVIIRGDKVRVHPSPDGPVCEAVIGSVSPPNDALSDCALVEFPNDTAQWMGGKHLEVIN